MLLELTITNLAIIESLHLALPAGLSVLTGETGTGKSIIVDAMMLLLGGRSSAEMIRTGCETLTVEGVFDLGAAPAPDLLALLEEQGLADDPNTLILRREVSRTRRGLCRVNGHVVTLSVLEEVGRHLVDIHGQGEHLSLIDMRNHVLMLDAYAGLEPLRERFGTLARQLGEVRRELAALHRDERELARRIDLLGYQLDEIDSACLREGEEEELRDELRLLGNAERRLELAAGAHARLAEGEARSALDLLGRASQALTELAQLDPATAELAQQGESALYQLEDLARTLRTYRDDIEYDPKRLAEVEERLQLLSSLKRKYGATLGEVLAYRQRAQAELDGIEHSAERGEQLEERQQTLLEEMSTVGAELSARRQEAATRLSEAIERELAELSMETARFAVDLRREPAADGVPIDPSGERLRFDRTGLDQVEFLISPNPGEELKPLARIASGGETSRLMLAMKTVLSRIDPVPTLIFDEIDTGIGGRTGDVVGRKLRSLAADHQVLCVTHLGQIACYGDAHYRVTKEVVGERTVSQVTLLDEAEREQELAVMLGGAATEASRRSARELLARRLAQDSADGVAGAAGGIAGGAAKVSSP
ncbi:MAG: DNA repair protein RecN [Anaerolineales bacterium]